MISIHFSPHQTRVPFSSTIPDFYNHDTFTFDELDSAQRPVLLSLFTNCEKAPSSALRIPIKNTIHLSATRLKTLFALVTNFAERLNKLKDVSLKTQLTIFRKLQQLRIKSTVVKLGIQKSTSNLRKHYMTYE